MAAYRFCSPVFKDTMIPQHFQFGKAAAVGLSGIKAGKPHVKNHRQRVQCLPVALTARKY
ncbi:MAG: hypothetical protein LBH00_00325 [Planctomycetaceae bacterium]|jgi:hypothetical protein|nr:hypothetical protein [Planctomycetaceae bacterium]